MFFSKPQARSSRICVWSDSIARVDELVPALAGLGPPVVRIERAEITAGHPGEQGRDVFVLLIDDARADWLGHVRAIRAHEPLAGIVCVVAQATPSIRVDVGLAGGDHCLDRSTPPDLLRSVVRALLRRL